MTMTINMGCERARRHSEFCLGCQRPWPRPAAYEKFARITHTVRAISSSDDSAIVAVTVVVLLTIAIEGKFKILQIAATYTGYLSRRNGSQ
jgi:hypothetical protein